MARIDLEKEYLDNRKRKKRAKLLGLISSSALTGFVIISYLGYSVGQHLANTTTVALIDRNEDIGLTEVGFRVPSMIPFAEQDKYGLVSDPYNVGGFGYVYWTSTVVTGQVIRYIVNFTGYSTNNTLEPITTGRFKKGDPIKLYKSPDVTGNRPHTEQLTEATPSSYIGFDLLLRVARRQPNNDYVGVGNYGIYLNRDMQFYGEEAMLSALRFGFESGLTSDVISPGRLEKGTTQVGGRLDLDKDGYYDTTTEETRFQPSDPIGYKYEIAYGDFLEPLSEVNWGPVTDEDIPASGMEPLSFYNAVSEAGVRPLQTFTPALQEYAPLTAYHYENELEGLPIAITDQKGIAELNVYIWLEGWDHNATDNLKDKTFGANLRFTASEVKV